MHEVDAAEEAKQVALYRYELTGELYDDDEILNFFYNDITELVQEQRDEIRLRVLARRDDQLGQVLRGGKRRRAMTHLSSHSA